MDKLYWQKTTGTLFVECFFSLTGRNYLNILQLSFEYLFLTTRVNIYYQQDVIILKLSKNL